MFCFFVENFEHKPSTSTKNLLRRRENKIKKLYILLHNFGIILVNSLHSTQFYNPRGLYKPNTWTNNHVYTTGFILYFPNVNIYVGILFSLMVIYKSKKSFNTLGRLHKKNAA